MGAAIHTHVEYKTADGRWLHYAAPCVKRDYKLFALIAGIRNDSNAVKPMVGPRGLPDDLSEVTQVCLQQDEAAYGALKGKTWLSAGEFAELQRQWCKLNPGGTALELDFEETVFRAYGPGGSSIAGHEGFADARVIFWFDD